MQMRFGRSVVMILLIVLMGAGSIAQGQGRLNDKDLQRLMQNLKEDAQPFRQSFAVALKKSTIRKTSRERDARALADTFAKQSDLAFETFKRKRKAENEVAALVGTAGQIDSLVYSLNLNQETISRWEKLRTELHEVAQSVGVREPYYGSQTSAIAPVANDTQSCIGAVGAKRSKQLVIQCTQVSPATHPPCNAQNACSLIVSEIKRGCLLIGQGAPAFCAEYR